MKHAIQIIGGEFRSRKIEVIDADGLRPTASRVRETLFNWLQNIIPGAIVIDAFAGTGALGIEALSRGAKKAIFIEKDPQVFKTLQANLHSLKIPAERYTLIKGNSLQFLEADNPILSKVLELVEETGARLHLFLDPPFFHNLYPELLKTLTQNPLLTQVTSISIESPLKVPFNTLDALHPLNPFRTMKTKESLLEFYRREA